MNLDITGTKTLKDKENCYEVYFKSDFKVNYYDVGKDKKKEISLTFIGAKKVIKIIDKTTGKKVDKSSILGVCLLDRLQDCLKHDIDCARKCTEEIENVFRKTNRK